jgi:hypothetical protein
MLNLLLAAAISGNFPFDLLTEDAQLRAPPQRRGPRGLGDGTPHPHGSIEQGVSYTAYVS